MFLEFSHIQMRALPVQVRGVECYLPQLTVEQKCVACTYRRIFVGTERVNAVYGDEALQKFDHVQLVKQQLLGQEPKFQPCCNQCLLKILLHFTPDSSETPD